MTFDALEQVLRALQDADVRYLVAGGVAVNAHGYQRLTHDLDLVLDLEPGNVQRALEALGEIGYRPSLPVPAESFADPEAREAWHRERNLRVFPLVGPDRPGLTVDVFVTSPFPFEREYERALVAEVAQGVETRFVALDTLIRMKEGAGRPRDQDDVQHLRWIQEKKEATDG